MDHIKSFSRYLRSEKRCSEHTLAAYENDVRAFLDFLGSSDTSALLSVSTRDIRGWIISMSESGMSPRTIHRRISALRTLYKHLQVLGEIDHNPATIINLPKIPRRLPQFVQEQAMTQLLDNNNFGEGYEGIRNKLIIELFYDTGMRLAEMISLRLSDVDMNSRFVKVQGKRSRERIIPLPGECYILLKKYLDIRTETFGANASPWLFLTSKGEKVYPKLIYRIVHSSLATVTTLSKKSPHVLRHTYASVLLNRGADLNAIKELLGHANLNATQVYTHTTFEQLNAIYKQAHPRA